MSRSVQTVDYQGFSAIDNARSAIHALLRGMDWLKKADARLFQIAFLAGLLTLGVLARDFSLRPEQMALTFVAGLATQVFWVRRLNLPQVGVLSALITCFGLSILLRADSIWVHPLIAVLALSTKFVVRVSDKLGSKHLFNPANLGVIAAITLLPGTWISPGQWGSDLAAALLFVALGGVVTQRARRVDTSWIFLGTFLLLIAARLWWLDVPTPRIGTLLWHQLQNGALLLFTFFMISDPMTTPNHSGARIFHALTVAVFAWVWQMLLYQPAGPVWALFLLTPLVPLLDFFFKGTKHQWRPVDTHAPSHEPSPKASPEPLRPSVKITA